MKMTCDVFVFQVSAGCGHTGILTERGEVFTCGDDRYGQLGMDIVENLIVGVGQWDT